MSPRSSAELASKVASLSARFTVDVDTGEVDLALWPSSEVLRATGTSTVTAFELAADAAAEATPWPGDRRSTFGGGGNALPPSGPPQMRASLRR